jgi:TolB-like protein/Tfp pilus assembly protein PilF
MTDSPEHPSPEAVSGGAAAPSDGAAGGKKKKKKDKVRSAWIAFVGRIVAQIVGAVAAIGLGLLFIQNYGTGRTQEAAAPAPTTDVRPARTRTPGAGGVALAVLPLDNFSGDASQEYFADGMTEALIADLAGINGLRVISRTSSMQYKGQKRPLPEIARELAVDFILEGSVARSSDRVRITAQLIDAATDEHVWTGSFDRTIRDVLALQTDIANQIAREVNVAVTEAGAGSGPRRAAVDTEAFDRYLKGRQAWNSRAAVDPEAFDLYLKGRQAWNRRTVEGAREARRYFEQSVQRDPMFALGYAGLADTYTLMPSPGESLEKARAAAARAIELDPNLAEAHTSLGALHHRYDRNVAAAEADFLRALELNPAYATAHQWYAMLLAEEGRDADALRHAEQAVALDPLMPAIRQTCALVHYYGRRFGRAIEEARRGLELQADLPVAREVLARALLASDADKDVVELVEALPEPRSPELLGLLSVAYRRTGDPRADALFRRLQAARPFPVHAVARWYAATGNGDAALALMQRTHDDWNFSEIKADPVFDGIRNDARFVALSRTPR